MWIAIFIFFLLHTTSLAPSREVKTSFDFLFWFLSIDGISGPGTEERRCIPAGLFSLECSLSGRQMFQLPLWPRVQTHTICSGFIKSRSVKYLLWKERTSWSKRVILARTVLFMTPLLIFQTHFFCFCNTCLFRTSSNVAGRNIFYYIVVWLQNPFAVYVNQKYNVLSKPYVLPLQKM